MARPRLGRAQVIVRGSAARLRGHGSVARRVGAAALLVAFAVAPYTGSVAGTAVGALLLVGTLVGALALSRRDACAILSLLLVLLLLVPQDYVLVGPLKSVGSPAVLVGLGALATWIAARFLDMTPAAEMHPVRWVLLAFAISSAASYAAGLDRDLTNAEVASMDRVVFQLLALLGVALLAVDGLDEGQRLTVLLERVVLAGGLAAFVGVMEFMFKGFDYRQLMLLPGLTTNVDLVADTRSGFERIAAAASHPIEFSVVTAALVPLALHTSRYAKSGRWRHRLALVTLLVAVPLSVSRSGFLTLAVGLGVYAVALPPRGKLNALVLGFIGIGVFQAAVPGLLGTVRSLFVDAGIDPSIQGRTDDYAAIPALMEGHWWLGRGVGTFLPDVYFFLDNQYLGSLLAGGLIGLVVFCALHVVGYSVARGVRRRSTDEVLRSEGQAIAATIAAIGVAAVAFDSLSFKQSSFLLFLLIGCAGARWTSVRLLPKKSHRAAPVRAQRPPTPELGMSVHEGEVPSWRG